MTNRLSFWVCVALALAVIGPLALFGFSWAALLLPLLYAPVLLAALLLARAAVLAIRGRPLSLRVRGRDVLGGAAGFVAPLLLLLAMTVAREVGLVSLKLCASSYSSGYTTHTSAWRDEAIDPALSGSGLVVHAPAGPLGDAFAQELHGQWLAGDDSRLHGDVTLTCEPPFGAWPFYKSAAVNAVIDARLQLRGDREGAATRGATLDMRLEYDYTMVGIASRRDFHAAIGSAFGTTLRNAIDKHVRKAN